MAHGHIAIGKPRIVHSHWRDDQQQCNIMPASNSMTPLPPVRIVPFTVHTPAYLPDYLHLPPKKRKEKEKKKKETDCLVA